MNEKKIAFILCTNDDLYLSECEKNLRRLFVPEGHLMEIHPVRGAASMCAGYNSAMRASDAKYKIYLHQDTFLLNRYFLMNLLTLFRAHPNAGMIGMMGNEKLSGTGIMWRGKYRGNMYTPTEEPYRQEQITPDTPVYRAECIDGFLIATQADLPWREDLFDGWDFYDASQSMEFRRAGYEILIPEQTVPWCLHDDGKILSLFQYDHYREIFLTEYGTEIGESAADAGIVAKSGYTDAAYIAFLKKLGEDASMLQAEITRICGLADEALKRQGSDAFLAIMEHFAAEPGRTALTRSTELLRLKQMIDVLRAERQAGVQAFIDGVSSYAAFREKYLRCTFAFREIEFATDEAKSADAGEAIRYLLDQRLSAYSAAAILYNLISLLGHRERILMTVAGAYLDAQQYVTAYQYLTAIQDPSAEVTALRDELKAALT